MAQNHVAMLDLRKRMKIELLPGTALRSDSAAYTNLVHVIEPASKKSCVYRVNKIKTKLYLLRFAIDAEVWEQVADVNLAKNANLFLTLIPMFSGRFIAILGDLQMRLYDTTHREWVPCELIKGSHPVVPRKYPGAFQLPFKFYKDRRAKLFKHLEFVMFNGGLPPPMPHMQHLSLSLLKVTHLEHEDDLLLDPRAKYKALINVRSLTTRLPIDDYFPLNHAFLM